MSSMRDAVASAQLTVKEDVSSDVHDKPASSRGHPTAWSFRYGRSPGSLPLHL